MIFDDEDSNINQLMIRRADLSEGRIAGFFGPESVTGTNAIDGIPDSRVNA